MRYIFVLAFTIALAVAALACHEARSGEETVTWKSSAQETSICGIEVVPGTMGRKHNALPGEQEYGPKWQKEYDKSQLAEALEKLTNPDEKERESALYSFKRLRSKGESAFDEIFIVLRKDESPRVRMLACDALAAVDLGSSRLMLALIEALDDNSTWVQAHAAASLAAYGKTAQAALPRLLELIAIGDEWMSDDAARAAWRVDPQAVIELSYTLRDDLLRGNPNEQRQAAIALGAIGPHPKPADPESVDMESAGPEIERFHTDISFHPGVNVGYSDSYPRVEGEIHPELKGVVSDLLKVLVPPQGLKVDTGSTGEHDDIDFTRLVIQALGKYQHHANAAVPSLISYLGFSVQLQYGSDEERWAVEEVEKKIRVESAVALMRIAPTDPDQILEILRLVNSRDNTKQCAVRMLGNLGADAGEHLEWLGIAVHADDADNTVFDVIKELGPLASPAVPGLMEFLPQAQFQSKPGTIIALADIGPGAIEAIPVLIGERNATGMFNVMDPMAGDEVIKAIAQIDPNGKETLDLVTECLQGKGQYTLRAGLECCRWIKARSIPLGELILEQFDNDDHYCRLLAARGIIPYAIENPSILDALVGLLGDDSTAVRAAAYSAFVEITLAKPQLKAELEKLIKAETNRDLDYAPLILGLVLDASKAWSPLSKVVSSEVEYMRVYAYEELAARGPAMAPAIPALLEQSKQFDSFENRRIAAAICRIDASQAAPLVPDLIIQLNYRLPEYRQEAAWLLGEIGYPARDAVDALETACYDWDLSVRNEAARAIAKIKHL